MINKIIDKCSQNSHNFPKMAFCQIYPNKIKVFIMNKCIVLVLGFHESLPPAVREPSSLLRPYLNKVREPLYPHIFTLPSVTKLLFVCALIIIVFNNGIDSLLLVLQISKLFMKLIMYLCFYKIYLMHCYTRCQITMAWSDWFISTTFVKN